MNATAPEQMLAEIARLHDEVTALKKRRRRKANVNGGSGEVDRGTWCTPKSWAERVGPWDLDPFSNPRSHIVSDAACMLERGDDGLADRAVPGSYRIAGIGSFVATAETRVFIQPDYQTVLEAVAHYGHTRFCALLRFDPSTVWFKRLYRRSQLVCVPWTRMPFEPPPGVKDSSNPHAHALLYARAEDATPAVLRACLSWRRHR